MIEVATLNVIIRKSLWNEDFTSPPLPKLSNTQRNIPPYEWISLTCKYWMVCRSYLQVARPPRRQLLDYWCSYKLLPNEQQPCVFPLLRTSSQRWRAVCRLRRNICVSCSSPEGEWNPCGALWPTSETRRSLGLREISCQGQSRKCQLEETTAATHCSTKVFHSLTHLSEVFVRQCDFQFYSATWETSLPYALRETDYPGKRCLSVCRSTSSKWGKHHLENWQAFLLRQTDSLAKHRPKDELHRGWQRGHWHRLGHRQEWQTIPSRIHLNDRHADPCHKAIRC